MVSIRKTIPLREYIKIVHPQYVYLKLTPTNSIRNYNSDKIAKAIASLHRNLLHRIRKRNNQYFFDVPVKVAYYIYIERSKVEFYFIVPDTHLTLIKEKIGDTWHGITITRVEKIPVFSDKAIKYKLSYAKEDALSLAVDRRTNTLLSSVLNVIDVLEEDDKVGIFYNFLPTSQYSWRTEYQRTIDKWRNNQPIDRQKLSVQYAVKLVLSVLTQLLNTILDSVGSLLGGEAKKQSAVALIDSRPPLSSATLRKKDAQILKTQIAVLSESIDTRRAANSALAVCEAFRSISEDNELTYRRYRGNFDPLKYQLPGVDTIITAPAECQNFISLPGRELLEEHKVIEKIDTYESEVPVELRSGVMFIGTNTYRGKTTKAYLTTDPEYKNLALVIIGPTRAGKTTLLSNLARDAVNHGECTIVFDFCGNCEMSDAISSVFNTDKVLNIDCSNNLQGLGYNEVKHTNNDTFEQYRNAKIQTAQLATLIDSINASDKELSAKMDRYLEAASLVVFVNNGPIKDVFATLQDYRVRHKYIAKVPDNLKVYLDEYIGYLTELDDTNRNGIIVGTKLNLVAGIIDRVNKLKKNANMEMMLKRDCSQNIDLVAELQKSQLITIRVSESEEGFPTAQEKDIICTYWITKIWLALQIRKRMYDAKDRVKVNIIVDELYQVPHTQDFIRSKLSQMAKFNCKMIISCHYLGQIDIIRDELKAANSSYMLISGCDKQNYRELAEELQPYTVEDLLNLKRYHSLNLIKYEKGYAKFITQLPKPINAK